MANPAKREMVNFEHLLRAKLAKGDAVARALAYLLIKKGVLSDSELVENLLAEEGDDLSTWQDKSTDGFTDTKGKKWR
jgi:hypothetical protein